MMFGWFGYATFHPGISSERTQKQLVKGAGVSFQKKWNNLYRHTAINSINDTKHRKLDFKRNL